ncbi:MAG: porin family protein [Geobacteraceae bacterium]|nr:porin family protein [Geobacteraceae bacterium]
MHRYLRVIVMICVLSIASISAAAPGVPGPYLSVFVGSSIFSDTTATNLDLQNSTAFDEKIKFNPGASFGGTGGYDFGLLRLEGEFSYKGAGIDSIRSVTNSYGIRNVDGDLGVYAGMVNIFVDLHNDSRITPYVGGGVGFATLSLSDTYGYVVTGSGSHYELLYPQNDDTVFAYQLGGGVDIALNRYFSLDLGYRYFRTNDAHFDSNISISNSLHAEIHNVTAGFKVKF